MSDSKLFQKIQDYFCMVNGIYLSCLTKKDGVMTEVCQCNDKWKSMLTFIGEEKYENLLLRLSDCRVENLIDEPLDKDYIRLYGLIVRVDNTHDIYWIIAAVIDEQMSNDERNMLPDGIIITGEARLNRTIEFLETMTRQLLITKRDEDAANEALSLIRKSDEEIKKQFHMLEAINSVIKLLEMDGSFTDMAQKALESAVTTIKLTGAFIIRKNVDGMHLDVIVSYGRKPFDTISITEVPFFTGKPYIISSDSVMPEKFRLFMEKQAMRAAIFQPVNIDNRTQMYVCFFDEKDDRSWEKYDVKFLNDTKRVIQSILTKKITTNSLAGSYASLEAILENSGCGIYVADMSKSEILYMNNYCKQLLSNIIEQNKLEKYIFSHTAESRSFTEVYVTEEDKWFDIHRTGIAWVDGRKVQLVTLYDITQKKRYQQRIENQANNDFLTGLYNRMRCEQDLAKFIDDSVKNDTRGAMIYIDLDDFKHINDGLGHQYGDVLLKAISHSLTQVKGIENHCYRMGGDEFIVIVTGSSVDRLESIINDIQQIFVRPWFLKGEDYYCTISAGVAFFPTDARTVEDVCAGAEALVRWNSATMGFINPVDFIPLAEYLGLINPIGEHVLREAAKHCRYWNDMGHPDYKVNVNLSVVQLLQNDIVKKIKGIIDEVGIEPGNLCLEVTESLAINDMVRMKRILSEIKALGVMVALDDFGTGYSSLNHIREMPLDIIKIDKCFIEHLGEDDFSDAFVKMVTELANTIGVHVCVEGVETDRQYAIIKKMGIYYIQGYFFDKPMCIESFEEKYI